MATFTGANALAAGLDNSFTATLNTAALGTFSASYTLSFSDENLAGATSLGSLVLNLAGSVESAFVDTADFDQDSDIDGRDFLAWQRGFGTGTTLATGDANNDDIVDGADLTIWLNQYGTPPPLVSALQAIPEPTAFALTLLATILTPPRRPRFSGRVQERFNGRVPERFGE